MTLESDFGNIKTHTERPEQDNLGVMLFTRVSEILPRLK